MPPPHDLLIRLLAYTGLRFGEAAGLRVRNVDFARGRLEVVENLTEANGHLHEGSPKARRTRSVPLPRFLRPELAAHIAGMDPDERVFTASRGGPLRNSNFRHYIFDPAVARAGLAPLTPHDLRDTAASLAISAGANVKTVQRMLGHASAAMTLESTPGSSMTTWTPLESGCRMPPPRTTRTQCGPTTRMATKTAVFPAPRCRSDLR